MRNAGGLHLLSRNQGPRLRAGEGRAGTVFGDTCWEVDTRYTELGEGDREGSKLWFGCHRLADLSKI